MLGSRNVQGGDGNMDGSEARYIRPRKLLAEKALVPIVEGREQGCQIGQAASVSTVPPFLRTVDGATIES
jgi:hypothetical protein